MIDCTKIFPKPWVAGTDDLQFRSNLWISVWSSSFSYLEVRDTNPECKLLLLSGMKYCRCWHRIDMLRERGRVLGMFMVMQTCGVRACRDKVQHAKGGCGRGEVLGHPGFAVLHALLGLLSRDHHEDRLAKRGLHHGAWSYPKLRALA